MEPLGSYEDVGLAPHDPSFQFNLAEILERLAILEKENIELKVKVDEKSNEIEWLRTQLARTFI